VSGDVTACVINRNGEAHLPRCLEAVRERREAFHEVVLVDDASTDRSVDVARSVLPDLRVVRLPRSVGPGGARNAGLRETGGRWLLFLDCDVVLGAGCPEGLRQAAVEHQAAFAVPVVTWADRPGVIHLDGAGTHFLGLMVLTHAGASVRTLPSTPRMVDSFSTPCFLLDRTRCPWEEPFDESFLFNLEDHDLGLRARLAGLRIVSVPSARASHGSGTEGFSVRGDGTPPSVRTYCLIRNRWQILLKNYEVRTLAVLSPALALYEVFQLAGVVRRGWTREWLRSLGWMARNLSAVLEKRRRVQSTRTVSDRELLTGGPLPFRSDTPRTPLERGAVRVLEGTVGAWWWLTRRLV
jgi:GT2 family glycosyltransferase